MGRFGQIWGGGKRGALAGVAQLVVRANAYLLCLSRRSALTR
jgi:hypothetical protein